AQSPAGEGRSRDGGHHPNEGGIGRPCEHLTKKTPQSPAEFFNNRSFSLESVHPPLLDSGGEGRFCRDVQPYLVRRYGGKRRGVELVRQDTQPHRVHHIGPGASIPVLNGTRKGDVDSLTIGKPVDIGAGKGEVPAEVVFDPLRCSGIVPVSVDKVASVGGARRRIPVVQTR